MGRKPATSRDRMLLRLKMIVVALTAGVTVQQRMLRDAFILDGDPNDDDGFVWNLMHSQLMLAGQVAVLASALEPFLRPKTRYKVGPEKYSFERVERQFRVWRLNLVRLATFRFRAPDLRRLYAGLRFPGVVQTRSRPPPKNGVVVHICVCSITLDRLKLYVACIGYHTHTAAVWSAHVS